VYNQNVYSKYTIQLTSGKRGVLSMRKLITAAAFAAFAGTGGLAFADGMYAKPSLKDAPVVIPPPPWAGFYMGVHAGAFINDGDSGRVRSSIDDGFPGDISDFAFSSGSTDDEFMGGLHLGYNWQAQGSNFVYGLEADLSFADNVDYLASIRARLGVANERSLLYFTIGVAFADIDNDSLSVTYLGGNPDVTLERNSRSNDSETALVLGAGAEFKLSTNVSFGIEGLYYYFDDNNSRVTFRDCDDPGLGCVGVPPDDFATFRRDEDQDFWQVRARLTYHIQRDEYKAPLK
jgi:outer membrane immunogenic protein